MLPRGKAIESYILQCAKENSSSIYSPKSILLSLNLPVQIRVPETAPALIAVGALHGKRACSRKN